MTIESFEITLAMFLINRVETCRNAYGLTKILAWKFEIIDSGQLIRLLRINSYITSIELKGVSYFTVTQAGVKFLKNINLQGFQQELLGKYPMEREYINLLF